MPNCIIFYLIFYIININEEELDTRLIHCAQIISGKCSFTFVSKRHISINIELGRFEVISTHKHLELVGCRTKKQIEGNEFITNVSIT